MSTNKPVPASTPVDTTPYSNANGQNAPRIFVGLVVTFIGLFIFTIGSKPDWFGWDRSAVVGFVQIAVFLAGLALICLGGYISLLTLWSGRRADDSCGHWHTVGWHRLCDCRLRRLGRCIRNGLTIVSTGSILWAVAGYRCIDRSGDHCIGISVIYSVLSP